MTGYYMDAMIVYHGFVRAVDGTITTFDVRGAGTSVGEGTVPAAINAAGAITGLCDEREAVRQAPENTNGKDDAPEMSGAWSSGYSGDLSVRVPIRGFGTERRVQPGGRTVASRIPQTVPSREHTIEAKRKAVALNACRAVSGGDIAFARDAVAGYGSVALHGDEKLAGVIIEGQANSGGITLRINGK